jgi:hypothetical protein
VAHDDAREAAVVSGPAGEVRIGFFSFTEVTDPGAHRAYNEWHQLDHLPEQLPVPGIAWGQRWVSTPACRAARAVDGELLRPVHYMTLYLMTDPVDTTLDEFAGLARRLHEEGRFFGPRRSHLSGPFDVVAAAAAPRVSVSAAALPYRPTTGVYVVVEELAEGADPAVLRRAGDAGPVLEVPGVAGLWRFTARPSEAGLRWRAGERRVTVCFLDGDVLAASELLAPPLVAAGRAAGGLEAVFAGPFETVTPWRWDWFDAAGG